MAGISIETQRRLKELLLEIAKGEQALELQRQRLASMENFDPYSAF